MQSPMSKALSVLCGAGLLLIGPSALAAASAPAVANTSQAEDTQPFPSGSSPEAVRRWLLSVSTLAPAQVISIGADMVVGFAKTGSLDPVTGHIKGAELRGEALNPKFAKLIQARSSLATMDVDCAKYSALIHQTKLYSKPSLLGEVSILQGGGNWITPPRTAYLFEAIDAICRADFKRPLRDETAPVLAEARSSVSVPAPTPTPTPTPAPAPVLTPAQEPTTPPAPPLTAAKSSGPEVQIIAASTAEAAEMARQQLVRQLPQFTTTRAFRIQTVTVKGKTYYRGLFGGFEDRASATAFCKTVSATGMGCLVR